MISSLNGFDIDEYNIYGIKEGATTSICPKCSHDRSPKNQKAKCMSVFWISGLGVCNHCYEKRIQLHTYKKNQDDKVYLKPVSSPKELRISDELSKYAQEHRGISLDCLKRLKVHSGSEWMPKAQKEISVIKIPYYLHGELVNMKYRGANKDFKFEKGCELIMYNLDSIIGEKECIITEGEPDTWSFDEVGLHNVVSVPNGFTLPKKDGTTSINLDFINRYYDIFEVKEKIYLAVDNDDAGKCGETELIRRFGAEKCWIVDFKDCKDANEYLLKYGSESLRQTIKDANQVPLDHVETVSDYRELLEDFYLNGMDKGYTTGIKNLDNDYSTELGQYTIVTGAPQSGKSEALDAMCLGYALKYGFKTAFASPENKPNTLHTDKILRKAIGYRPNCQEHLDSNGFKKGIEFLDEHFYHIDFNDGYDLKRVLSKMEELVKRKGIRVIVLDPFNKVKLKESTNKNINEYTNDYLNEIDMFCKKHQVIGFLVAHPNKMKKVEGSNTFEMPTAYDIKGGGEMYDMAYHILGFVKDIEKELVAVKTLKVKFQHLGSADQTNWLKWNMNSGRYHSIDFDPDIEIVPVTDWDNNNWALHEPNIKALPEDKKDVFKQQGHNEFLDEDDGTLRLIEQDAPF